MTVTVTTGAEIEAGYRWLESALQGDTALVATLGDPTRGTNADRVTDDVPLPAVMYAFMGGSYTTVIGAVELYLSGLWQVKVLVEEDGLDVSGPVARRIQEILHGRNAEPIGGGFGVLHSCTRESPLSLLETDETGRTFRHLGGLYRLLVGSS